MAEYSITLNDEEFEDVICGLNMIIDRCCDYEEEKPYQELINKLKSQRNTRIPKEREDNYGGQQTNTR